MVESGEEEDPYVRDKGTAHRTVRSAVEDGGEWRGKGGGKGAKQPYRARKMTTLG